MLPFTPVTCQVQGSPRITAFFTFSAVRTVTAPVARANKRLVLVAEDHAALILFFAATPAYFILFLQAGT